MTRSTPPSGSSSLLLMSHSPSSGPPSTFKPTASDTPDQPRQQQDAPSAQERGGDAQVDGAQRVHPLLHRQEALLHRRCHAVAVGLPRASAAAVAEEPRLRLAAGGGLVCPRQDGRACRDQVPQGRLRQLRQHEPQAEGLSAAPAQEGRQVDRAGPGRRRGRAGGRPGVGCEARSLERL